MKFDKDMFKADAKNAAWYIVVFLKWILLSIAVAIVCGGVGILFHTLIEKATELRTEHNFILYFLPLGGVIIVFLYHIFKLQDIDGTNYVIRAVRKDGYVPFTMAPGILIATVLTHMLGGSAGREGAALQLGGSLGSSLGKIFRLDKDDMHVITAVVFVMEVISVGIFYYSAIMPCVFTSVFTYFLTVLLNIHPISYILSTVPIIDPLNLLKVTGLGIVFAVMSIVFCLSLSKGGKLIHKALKNEYLRAIGLTLLLNTTDYNGAGMNVVDNAILNGTARPEAFILKLLFTVITLECGFKGGEIVPTFFIGATLGCTVAPLIGMDPGFGAALGLIGVFCGCTNAPLASIMLSIELFGMEGLPYFAIVVVTAFMLSGYFSLYKSQIIVYDKLKAIFVNRNTRN